MKKISLILLFVFCYFCAYAFEVDGIYYSINSDKSTVSVMNVTGIDPISGQRKSYPLLEHAVIPCQVTKDGVTYTVTDIKQEAFYFAPILKSVVLPNTIKTLPYRCFDQCALLESIVLPDSLVVIGEAAFRACKKLKDVTIPQTVTTIDKYAFFNCESIENITLPEGITKLNGSSFNGCISLQSCNIPNSVTSIDFSVFSGCSSLKSITIPENVTTLGADILKGCTLNQIIYNAINAINVSTMVHEILGNCSTTYLKIGDKVEKIPERLFYNTSKVKSITIPNSVKTIERSAFQGCGDLDVLYIGEGVTSIGSEAFNCNLLTKVYFNAKDCDDLTSCRFAKNSLQKIIFGDNITRIPAYLCASQGQLTEIVLPNSVTEVGSHAFYGCTNITKLRLSESLINIKDYAFFNLENLPEIIIPQSVTTIEKYAFGLCKSLTEITIPDNVEFVGEQAFSSSKFKKIILGKSLKSFSAYIDSDVLEEVYSYAITPPSYTVIPFYRTGNATLYVPRGSVEKYKSLSGWNKFKYIREFVTLVGDVNGDGKVDVADINAIINTILEYGSLGYEDVNEDGKVDVADINAVINIILES